MLKNQLIVDGIFISVIILFLNFFSLTLIEDTSKINSLGVIGSGTLMGLFTLYSLLFKKGIERKTLDNFVLFFMASIIISMFMANLFWEQTFINSFKEYKYFYIYFLYFIPVFLDIEPERLLRILVIFFILTIGIFIIDYITFPEPLFAWRNEERRDGITIFF